MHTKAKVSGSVVAGFPSPAEQYQEPPLDLNELLVKRPVAVLSNNDGCCVARSNEFKALGIPMGTPYFQLKHREASGELCFCSSNYELYGDMSRRIISILREEAVDVERQKLSSRPTTRWDELMTVR